MEATAAELSPDTEVRALLDSYFDAVRSAEIDRITSHYAPDLVAYDAIGPFEFVGVEAYEAHWRMCLEMCREMIFEPREPVVAASGDLAFAHCLVRCGGVGPDGKEQSGWVRTSFAARRRNGRWLIVHEHYSVPFDPVSGKAQSEPDAAAAGPVSAA